jgi:hypothetical protein
VMVLYLVLSFYIYLDLQKHSIRVDMTAILTVVCKNINNVKKFLRRHCICMLIVAVQYLYFKLFSNLDKRVY